MWVLMNSFLLFIAVSCGVIFLLRKLFASDNASATVIAVTPTLAQRKHKFIVDVCDGSCGQAERLIAEKAQLHPGAGAGDVLNMVYQDMLELTADERAAAYVSPFVVRKSTVSSSVA